MDRRKIWQNIYTYIRRLITETPILLALQFIEQEQNNTCDSLSSIYVKKCKVQNMGTS
jgi:hypothetical protein